MQKWEYARHPFNRQTSAPDELNKLGAEGWELVDVGLDGNGYFKRPLVEAESKQSLSPGYMKAKTKPAAKPKTVPAKRKRKAPVGKK